MYVARVRVRDIRGFTGAREVDLTLTRPDGTHAGWTVLAGDNGSGKTTLLRAVALAVRGERAALRLHSHDGWLTRGAERGECTVDLVRDPVADQFSEQVGADLPGVRARMSWDEEMGPTGEPSVLASAGPWRDEPQGWLCAGYGPFRRLVGKPLRHPATIGALATLFDEEATLVEGVEWLVFQYLRSLESHGGSARLMATALRVLGDGLLPDGYEVDRVDSAGLWVTRGGQRFALREMSEGYRTVAALVVDLIRQVHEAFGELPTEGARITAPGVVLIDEVGAHLHVSWQKRIGGWLTEHFPNVQFIVSTHSPYVCQAADPGGLIRLPGPDEDVPPHVADEQLYGRVVYGSADDAVLSELFGLRSGYSDRAQLLRRELTRLEIEVVSGRADEEQVRRYRELTGLLTSSPSARVDEVTARLVLERITGE
ncbi:AAA family ATPase [Kutzneria viridogrisea]|uniref:AAA+ ATPase domain-containing protein n=2 Tax=Kutzneria TaxID=43356 RepID=W5WLF2_9PSEU|nr:AAA family ATPase [Kutzneria albida]AHI01643.1 hypothetical protein KALB_8286 [Kutzneria albida DSM 43870]MBA8931606.1 energy-coupling factor transporter ATP-binding protein EcfA2 [Kutzneria viridogrisea]